MSRILMALCLILNCRIDIYNKKANGRLEYIQQTKGSIKNGLSRDTSNISHNKDKKTQHKN